MRRTKIIATIGPASVGRDVLARLVAAGVDVMRLNASHTDVPELTEALEAVREVAAVAGRHIAVMVDLPGPKLRVGDMEADVVLVPGATFSLVGERCVGDASRAWVSWPDLWRDLGPGARVLLDDGRIELRVTASEPDRMTTEVVEGGALTSNKGIAVPGARLSMPGVTERDRMIAAWARDAGADYVAQSFVRSAEDIAEIREVLGSQGPWLIAKIEKYEAVSALDEIVAAADAVMVARGDLGVEMPVEQVPVLQRRIVEKAQAAGKPVAVATQMLDSMIDRSAPTRAEASDVATAIFEGADAVMLSAETAVGKYPVEAVEMMARIALAAEPEFEAPPHETVPRSRDVAGAVSAAIVTLAENLDVAAIITATRSGASAMAVAGWRPESTIVAATTEASTARRLALVWGVKPMLVEAQPNVDDTLMGAVAAACDAGFVVSGDLVAITAGVAVNVSGGTDLIRVVTA
jgi:pyruvate kinase